MIAVGQFAAPHPARLPVPAVTIKPDGADTWRPRFARLRPEDARPEEIAARVAEAGIVGMGGAAFRAPVKLTLGKNTTSPRSSSPASSASLT